MVAAAAFLGGFATYAAAQSNSDLRITVVLTKQ